MPLPETVDILGFTHTVTAEDNPDFTSRYYGEITHSTRTIRVGTHTTGDQTRETLLHEVIHGIDYAMSTDLSEEDVSRLARGVYAVLRANPPLAEFLLERDIP